MDRVARSRALDRARWLIRDHGEAAEAVLAAKLARPDRSRVDRAFYRMIARELRALRAAEARATRRRRSWLDRLGGLLPGRGRGSRD